MSSAQEYWDACMIRSWRNFQTIGETTYMFNSICNKWPEEIQPRLLRLPADGTPRNITIRYFVAHFLPKINDFLCDQLPEKDVDLLRALKKSKMDTFDRAYKTNADKEKDNTISKVKRDRVKMAGNTISYNIRNHDTNWNVTKGSFRRGRA